MQGTKMKRFTSHINEMNLFKDKNWHENIENNLIEIASHNAGREKYISKNIYWTKAELALKVSVTDDLKTLRIFKKHASNFIDPESKTINRIN